MGLSGQPTGVGLAGSWRGISPGGGTPSSAAAPKGTATSKNPMFKKELKNFMFLFWLLLARGEQSPPSTTVTAKRHHNGKKGSADKKSLCKLHRVAPRKTTLSGASLSKSGETARGPFVGCGW
jgi:hypothetical protein